MGRYVSLINIKPSWQEKRIGLNMMPFNEPALCCLNQTKVVSIGLAEWNIDDTHVIYFFSCEAITYDFHI